MLANPFDVVHAGLLSRILGVMKVSVRSPLMPAKAGIQFLRCGFQCWVPASAGTNGCGEANAPLPLILCGAGYAVVPAFALRASAGKPSSPRINRGDGAPSSASCSQCTCPFGHVAPLGAPSRRLTPAPGRAFGAGYLSQGLSASLSAGPRREAAPQSLLDRATRPPSASSWQEALVPPGGAPAPPGCGGYVSSPARRRRIRSHFHNAS